MTNIVLNREETEAFVRNMMKPDPEMLRRRDAFLARIPPYEIDSDGVLHADVPEIEVEE